MTSPSPNSSPHRRNRIRAKLRQAAFSHAPMWLSRGSVARCRSVQRMHVVQHVIPIPHLPFDLMGLKIAHLSDFHIGPILKPKDLPRIVAAVMRLEPHLIALTGDFVDLSIEVADDVIAALLKLHAPLGVWLVLGNHDHLDNGPELIRRFHAAGLNLLVNQTVRLQHQGQPVLVSGIDFAHKDRDLAHLVSLALKQIPAHDKAPLRLLLSHHPHAFDAACRHQYHLTLAGHTHGGQLSLPRAPAAARALGLANLAFRYPRGLYQQGDHYLYVTSGVGSWFPLRIHCPAEIALLTLIRAEHPSSSR